MLTEGSSTTAVVHTYNFCCVRSSCLQTNGLRLGLLFFVEQK